MVDVMQEQEQELKQEGLTVVERAMLVKITDQLSYDYACELLQETIIPFRKRWSAYWEPLKSSAYRSYKAILDKFKEGDDPAETAERAVKAEIRKWDDAQERIRAELQRKAQEEAEKAAEEERLQAAIVAEESGASDAEVQAIVEVPIAAVAPPVERTYTRATGVSKRENWKAVVKDFHALVKAAAKDKSLLAYLEANQSALNARAKADRQTLNIPGVVPWNDAVVSARENENTGEPTKEENMSNLAIAQPPSALNARAKADRQTLNIPGVVPWNDAVVSGRGK